MRTSTLVLISLLQLSIGHHIIFENIGQLATGVTYIHSKITINITSIEEHYGHYISTINLMKTKLVHQRGTYLTEPPTNGYDLPSEVGNSVVKTLNVLRDINYYAINQIINWRTDGATKLIIKLSAIKNSMPLPKIMKDNVVTKREIREKLGNYTREFIQDKMKDAIVAGVRNTRFIGAIQLGLGALGTFMGIYNARQTEQLKKNLATVSEVQNQLIEVVQDQDVHIQELKRNEKIMLNYLTNTTLWNPALVTAELFSMEVELQNRIDQAVHGIQMAQLRRLAVDILPVSQLKALYRKIERQANLIGHTLLTNQPSDLYQLEISYFFDGHNVNILLHIPSVPKDSLLRLLKLHPFPLPINSNFSVIPSVKNDILAISSGFQRYSAQISSVDLLGCYSINNIYLCEKSGVLSKDLNGTCMGALYIQDINAAQELCDLEIQTSQEIVRPLLRNQFLIFSPLSQTSFITCTNGTQSEKYVPQGISKLEISAGCKANLQQHILVTDNAIHLEGDIVHYEWSFDPRAKLPFMDEEFNDRIEELLNSGITTPTMNDLQHLRAKKSKLKYLWYFISFILSIVACSLITLLIMVLWCRYPLSRLPCCGPVMMAFSLVSKVRKFDVKPIIKPKPKQRRKQPPPPENNSDSAEMEELHPIARNVQ
jgi:hypothetical protein